MAGVDEAGEVLRDEEVLHHQPVLDGQRLVQPESVPHGGERGGGGAAAGDAGGGVGTWRGEENEKHQNADGEKYENHFRQAAQQDQKNHFCTRIFARGSKASRTPSPKKFSATTVSMIARPGAMATAGRV